MQKIIAEQLGKDEGEVCFDTQPTHPPLSTLTLPHPASAGRCSNGPLTLGRNHEVQAFNCFHCWQYRMPYRLRAVSYAIWTAGVALSNQIPN